jgi:hypothetical protein
MFLDGSHQTQLTHGTTDELNPDWSSRGGTLQNGLEAPESIVYGGDWKRAAEMSRELIADGTAVWVAEGLLGATRRPRPAVRS